MTTRTVWVVLVRDAYSSGVDAEVFASREAAIEWIATQPRRTWQEMDEPFECPVYERENDVPLIDATQAVGLDATAKRQRRRTKGS